ncbi:unnamed protein product [Protopolystoma xenopodis]|uniref:Methionyl/Leucyl tRNA synthetase domain-containing protein n=1 Tax=Protopolystoma xenopodis TaxID=117903 RepID=A0A448WSR4_9PLAT|nr:unnamed protein product [Protopolystoma xenopodis]
MSSTVSCLQTRLSATNDIYWGEYSGWYARRDEAFYADHEVVSMADFTAHGGNSCSHVPSLAHLSAKHLVMQGRSTSSELASQMVSRDTGAPVEWLQEETCFFRLTSYRNRLHAWLDSGVFSANSSSQAMWKKRAHELVDSSGDLSVSRPNDRLNWALSVPGTNGKHKVLLFATIRSSANLF